VIDSLNSNNRLEKEFFEYALSFPEWFAQQTSIYLQRTEEFHDSKLKEFFEGLVELLKNFYNHIKPHLRPAVAFENWMGVVTATSQIERELGYIPGGGMQESYRGYYSGTSAQSAFGQIEKVIDGAIGLPMRPSVDKFGKFSEYVLTLLQIGQKFPHLAPVQKYISLIQEQWTDKIRVTSLADETRGAWNKLGKNQGERLAKFLYDVTLDSLDKHRRLTTAELDTWRSKHGLSDSAMRVYTQMDLNFQDILQEIEQHLRAQAAKVFAADKFQLDIAMEKLDKEFQLLRDRNYFPLTRFGQYSVTLKAPRDLMWEGKKFKAGDVMSFETYEMKREAQSRANSLRKLPNVDVEESYIPDTPFTFSGFPPAMLESMKMELGLDAQQLKQFRDIVYRLSPGQSFKKHLLRRRGVAGFSADAKRAYASYMMHAASHISRMKFYQPLQEQIGILAAGRGSNTVARQRLVEYLRNHYSYMVNPGNEWAAVRSALFTYYLGFSIKSALVNLTQIPMVGYPYLASRYGDVQAVAELTKAIKDVFTFRPLSPVEEALIQQGQSYLNESLASELAAVAEGSNLDRMLGGTDKARYVRAFQRGSAFLFKHAEMINRRITFLAAVRLAAATGVLDVEAAGRAAVQTSMFEYQKWNRPQIARGKKSVFFVFQQYMQHMTHFLIKDKGGSRALVMLLASAGLMGLPGAEDLLDMFDGVRGLFSRLFGWGDPYHDAQTELREFMQEVGLNPELMMHGLSRNSFWLQRLWSGFPEMDISGSLSLGKIVPTVEPFSRMLRLGTADPRELIGEVTTSAGGAVGALASNMFRAMATDNPDPLKFLELVLPAAGRDVTRAYRYYTTGEATNTLGDRLLEFDVDDPNHLAEIFAQGMGFKPTRLTRMQEKSFAQRDAVKFYVTRQQILLTHYFHARSSGDREALADTEEAIRAYNKDVPYPKLRISAADKYASYSRRRDAQRKRERGAPEGKQYLRLYRDVGKAYE
jgi:hypothetical protein